MNLNDNVESVVGLINLYFDKITFWRSGAAIESANLIINFEKSYRFNESRNICEVHLGCNLHDKEDEVLKIEISITGVFKCDESNLEIREVLLKKNTLAILFPYIRSQISIVTAQPSMMPIVLPPVNIDAVFAESADSSEC